MGVADIERVSLRREIGKVTNQTGFLGLLLLKVKRCGNHGSSRSMMIYVRLSQGIYIYQQHYDNLRLSHIMTRPIFNCDWVHHIITLHYYPF